MYANLVNLTWMSHCLNSCSCCIHIVLLTVENFRIFSRGPNKSASAQYDNTRGAWLTQEGCTITERKEGRTLSPVPLAINGGSLLQSNKSCGLFDIRDSFWCFSCIKKLIGSTETRTHDRMCF